MNPTHQPDVEYISSPAMAGLPFSEVVRVGNTLYLSGQIGRDTTGQLVPGGIAAETAQALENIRQVLEGNHSSLDQVVKVTVMLADINEWAEMNKTYVTFFPQHYPARSAMGVNGLAMGARVEIECIAVVK